MKLHTTPTSPYGRIVRIVKDETGRLINRRRPRAGGGVGPLARVQQQRVEAEFVIRRHMLAPCYVCGFAGRPYSPS